MSDGKRVLRVSVALCTYNGERYLPQQLDSLIHQTLLPFEVVITDDCSTDSTWEILLTFKLKAEALGIRIALQKNNCNRGYIQNFRHTVCRCTGDVIFLCDQDDVWHLEKISSYENQFRQRPALLMLCSNARLVDESGQFGGRTLFQSSCVSTAELNSIRAGFAFNILIRRNIATGATMAVRAKVIRMIESIPDGWIHDEWLAMISAIHGEIDVLEKPYIDYRQHAANQLGAPSLSILNRITGKTTDHATFMKMMVIRSQSLFDYLSRKSSGNEMLLDLACRRLSHAKIRANLPTQFLPRLFQIAREYAAGAYGSFSNGLTSALRDVLIRTR